MTEKLLRGKQENITGFQMKGKDFLWCGCLSGKATLPQSIRFCRGVFCLQEYNSPEEYIKDVQRYIRWSRAKVVATRELSDHINDQYDALRENGLNQKEAMRKAIE